MKPANTDSQAVRRKNAILGAVSATLFRLAIVAIALWLRAGMDPARLTAKVLLMVLVLDLGSIPFIWVSLKNRLKEIQGGEEDAAAQY
ncbi:MAG: hypothetical protein K2O84_05075 [Oscillospiraceae bacterium]|nr:hypothetical protein [Oscillospiraceae bacterium]